MYFELNNQFLTTKEQFDATSNNTFLPVCCLGCSITYYWTKRQCRTCYNRNISKKFYCSQICYGNSKRQIIELVCGNCCKKMVKSPTQYKRTINHFCSQSCAGIFYNKHKTKGLKRSKLEKYIELKLTEHFEFLSIEYSNKTAIGSELDIYIPSLNLAFELNGIVHYKPIYGDTKFNQIQQNDLKKLEQAKLVNIDLYQIDTSQQKRFTPESSQDYLDTIINLISSRGQLGRLSS